MRGTGIKSRAVSAPPENPPTLERLESHPAELVMVEL